MKRKYTTREEKEAARHATQRKWRDANKPQIAARMKAYHAKRQENKTPARDLVVILDDPLDGGHFSSGVKITNEAFYYMLEYGTCTPGMVVREGGVRKRVIGDIGSRQRLIEAN